MHAGRGQRQPHEVPVAGTVKRLRALFGERAAKVAEDFRQSAKEQIVKDYWTQVLHSLEV